MWIFDPGEFNDDPEYWSASFAILADMDASDTAYVTIYQEAAGTVQTDLDGDRFFTGFLAC
jgi:hypothetical protein